VGGKVKREKRRGKRFGIGTECTDKEGKGWYNDF